MTDPHIRERRGEKKNLIQWIGMVERDSKEGEGNSGTESDLYFEKHRQ